MADPTIRPANLAVLVKIETTPGVDAAPDGTNAVPVEIGSFSRNTPFAEDTSNEATGSLVAAAPSIISKAATFSTRHRIKGAGAGVTYTASVKPPLHPILLAGGKKGLFTSAIATAVATAGTTASATLAAGFPTVAQALRGQRLTVTAGVNANEQPLIIDYTAGRVATFAETLASAYTTTSSLALAANWTYSGTTPQTAATELTDHPTATVYIYRGGKLLKYVGCRCVVTPDGASAKTGYVTADWTGIFAGETDASAPTLTLAGQSPPLLLQGSSVAEAFSINSLPLPISTFKLADAASVDSSEDPNTTYGFGFGVIGGRTPKLTCDPLATSVAVRDTLSQIGNGSVYPGVIRCGYTSGNRWALSFPKLQPVSLSDGERGVLLSEQIEFRVNPTGAADATGRDGEWTLVFD